MKTPLPEFLRPYFWDANFEDLEINKQPGFIIGRLLEKGNAAACKWVERTYSTEQVQEVLRTSRDFSLRNASFWGLIYDVPLSQLKCFYEPYRTMRKQLWPY